MALVFPLFMLLQMVSAGAMGGGILSAGGPRARRRAQRPGETSSSGPRSRSRSGFGAATTAAALLFGPKLYALMGGRDGSLAAAVTHSALVFSGRDSALGCSTSFAGDHPRHRQYVLSGGGDHRRRAHPRSRCRRCSSLGSGPVPAISASPAAPPAVAVLPRRSGAAIFAFYIWAGRGVLKPSVRPPKRRQGADARHPPRRPGLVDRQPLDQYQHRDRDRTSRVSSARPRWRATAPVQGSNISWCRWCSGSARRSPPWSAPRSERAAGIARSKWPGPVPQ